MVGTADQGAGAPEALATDSSESTEVHSRRDRRKARDRRLGPPGYVLCPLVFVVGCLVTVARSPQVILHPQFWAEDGTVYFQHAFLHGWYSGLLQPQAGYLQTSSRLVADVGLLLPLRDVPALFALVALGIQVLPAVFVVSRRFAVAVPDYRVRLLLAAAYLLVPNSSEVNVDLVNAQWHLAVLAVLIVLATPPRAAGRCFDIAVVAISCLTGPFALSLAVVVAITYFVRRQRWTAVLAVLVVACAAIQIIELETSNRPSRRPAGSDGHQVRRGRRRSAGRDHAARRDPQYLVGLS